MTVLIQDSAPVATRRRVDWHICTLVIIVAAILLIRVIDLNYNSAFVDEAIYITNGQQALQGNSGFYAVRYMFGSYLYPVLAALAGHLFGQELIGARVLSAVSTTIAALAVYVLARRLYNSLAGVAALIAVGFASNSQFVGQIATYDTLGIGLAAVAAAQLTIGLTDAEPDHQDRLVFYAGVTFGLSILTKYIALLLVPGLLVLLVGLLIQRDQQRVRLLLRSFMPPIALMLAGYGVLFFDNLLRFAADAGQYSLQPAAPGLILQTLVNALWPYLALAALGAGMSIRAGQRRQQVAAAALLVTALTLPLYHMLSGNIRSMDKHVVYSLVFLAPLVGAACARGLVWATKRAPAWARSQGAQAAGLLVVALACMVLNAQATQNLKHGWPDKRASLAFVAGLPMPTGTQVLAEGGETYALALDWGQNVTLIKTWDGGYTYGAATGDDAIVAAVSDHVFRYIVLDSYYTPRLSFRAAQAAIQAGYTVIHTDRQPISNGSTIITTVYAAPHSVVEAGHVSH